MIPRKVSASNSSVNSYSASACVGMAITGVIPLLVTLFLPQWINVIQLRST